MFAVDTHVHTCLSPCGELDMHPAALVEAAVRAGLDAVAVCDHNSAENAAAVERAGRAAGLAVIPGMEVTSEEEVHILGLLPDIAAALTLQSRIYRSLPGRNDAEAFGMQVIANELAEVLGFNEHLLAGATTLSVDAVVDAIHGVKGLAVASHVDRERFGIIGQLGLIPPGLELDALEVSRRTPLPEARAAFSPREEFPILCASDAHEPKDVGKATTFMYLAEPTVDEVRKAFAGQDGRLILGGGRPMEDLALHILDIAENTVEAGATALEIDLLEDPEADSLVVGVRDHGPGVHRGRPAHAVGPSFTARGIPKAGMGLSLLAEAARAAGGELVIDSKPGEGTRVGASFQYRHTRRPPVGDIETTLMVLLARHRDIDIRLRHCVAARAFELDSRVFRPTLASPQGLTALREAIRRGEATLAAAS